MKRTIALLMSLVYTAFLSVTIVLQCSIPALCNNAHHNLFSVESKANGQHCSDHLSTFPFDKALHHPTAKFVKIPSLPAVTITIADYFTRSNNYCKAAINLASNKTIKQPVYLLNCVLII